MKKTVYKKGDAQNGHLAPDLASAPVQPGREVPVKRTVSTVGARQPRTAPAPPPKRRKTAGPLLWGLLVLLLIAAAAAGTVALHEKLKAKEISADAESPAASLLEPVQPVESEPAESIVQPLETPEPEPEAEPTNADRIREAASCDPGQWPALAEALAGSENTAFLALDLSSGQTLAWQPDTAFYIASAIKAPYAWYLCRQLDEGVLQPDEMIVYEEKFFDEGAGTIKNSEPGTLYRLDDLMREALLRSDNIAYRLLVNRCGKEAFNALMDSVGVSEGLHFTATNIWPKATPRELALVWSAILDYIQSDAPHSELLAQLLQNSVYSPIRRALGSTRVVASKYGWDEDSYIDAGIVYSEEGQPQYLLTILTENGNREDGEALNTTAAVIRQIDLIITQQS